MTAWADLSKAEQGRFIEALKVPALWAFGHLAGQLGMQLALDLLDRELPPVAIGLLRAGGWTAKHLPPAETAQALLQGTQLLFRLQRDQETSLKAEAEGLGMTLEAAHAALRVVESYHGGVRPPTLSGVR